MRTVTVDEQIDVADPMSSTPTVLVSRQLAIPPLVGAELATLLIETVSVYGCTLVAAVAKIIPGSDISSRILIAHTDTGPAAWMQQRPLQASGHGIHQIVENAILTRSSSR